MNFRQALRSQLNQLFSARRKRRRGRLPAERFSAQFAGYNDAHQLPLSPQCEWLETRSMLAAATLPSAPTNVIGTAGEAQVTLTWTAPSSNGGSTLTDYLIQYSSDAGLSWSTFSHTPSIATTAIVTGLDVGPGYIFRVAAVNTVGTGPLASLPSPVMPFSPVADFNHTSTNGAVSITGYKGPGGSVVIPNLIEGMPVTGIGFSAFYGHTSLKAIIIPTTVTSIRYQAFYGCTGLTAITIPSNVTGIGDRAFYCCTGLTAATIPASVTSIGSYAFYSCSSLTAITIPSGVTLIGGAAFQRCTGLTAIAIPASVISVGGGAFSGCTGLTAITIGTGVTSIGEQAFSGCTGLPAITIPASVTSIGSQAYSGCTGLIAIMVDPDNPTFTSQEGVLLSKDGKTIVAYPVGKTGIAALPNSVTGIGDTAFLGCSGLTAITIPTSVTSIGSQAFAGCTGLTAITLPASVTGIGDGAFYGCTGVTAIAIPGSVTSIGSQAFAGCTGLIAITINSGVPSIGTKAFEGCTGLTAITIPASVTNIGDLAFYGCTGLTAITIPASVTIIGSGSFYGCTGLMAVFMLGNAPGIGASTFNQVPGTIYYLPGTTGWGLTLGGIPTSVAATPAAPMDPTALAGNAQTSLTWTVPSSNGGRPITDYTIQYSTNGSIWNTFPHSASTATTATVTGLANGTSYVFRIAAINGVGTGAYSVLTSRVSPLATTTGRPLAAAGNGYAALRWSAPAVRGRPPITDYAIRYSADSGATWTLYPHIASAATSRRLILTNGNTYIFQVAPVVAGGVGVYSPTSLAVTPYSPAAKPDAPTAVVGVKTGALISLSWNPVPRNAGGPVKDYVVQYRVNTPNGRWLTYPDLVSPSTSANLRLRAGYSYVFRVTAKNLAGTGAFSTQSTPVTA